MRPSIDSTVSPLFHPPMGESINVVNTRLFTDYFTNYPLLTLQYKKDPFRCREGTPGELVNQWPETRMVVRLIDYPGPRKNG